jgi:hypothetical protein
MAAAKPVINITRSVFYVSNRSTASTATGKQGQNNYDLPQISWVLELHDNVPDTTSGKWKMEIQDGGCQTGYEYICRL